MPRLLETDTNSGIDITSITEIGSYTADAGRLVFAELFADSVAGGGDYTMYLRLQINGAGSNYQFIPITTAEPSAGITEVAGQSIAMYVASGDILKAYIQGQGGDNSVDTIVRWVDRDPAYPAAGEEFTYTLTDSVSGLPIEGADVWMTTDVGGTNIVFRGTTDSFGVVRDPYSQLPRLWAGTWYVWRRADGYYFDDPDTEVIS